MPRASPRAAAPSPPRRPARAPVQRSRELAAAPPPRPAGHVARRAGLVQSRRRAVLDDGSISQLRGRAPRAVGNANSWQAAHASTPPEPRVPDHRARRAGGARRPRRREHRRHRLPRELALAVGRHAARHAPHPERPERLRLWLLRPRLRARAARPAERHRLDRERPPVGCSVFAWWWSDARHLPRRLLVWHPFAGLVRDRRRPEPRPRRPRHGHPRRLRGPAGRALPAGASTSPGAARVSGAAAHAPAISKPRPGTQRRNRMIAATTPPTLRHLRGIRARRRPLALRPALSPPPQAA